MTEQMAQLARDRALHLKTLEEISERSRTDRRNDVAVKSKRKRDVIQVDLNALNAQGIRQVTTVETGWVIRLQPAIEWEYIVVRAKMEGGRTGGRGGMDDDWPDALHVTVKLLNADGTYNDKAPDLKFPLNTNCYHGAVPHVWDTGKRMKRKVSFE